MKIYWVRVRWHRTNTEAVQYYASALERGLFVISAGGYADVLAQGEMTSDETRTNEESPAAR